MREDLQRKKKEGEGRKIRKEKYLKFVNLFMNIYYVWGRGREWEREKGKVKSMGKT